MVDHDGCLHAMKSLSEDPDFMPHFGVILDLRNIRSSPLLDELNGIAEALSHIKDYFAGKIAVVVEMVYYSMAILTSHYASFSGFTYGIFYDLHEAQRWISFYCE